MNWLWFEILFAAYLIGAYVHYRITLKRNEKEVDIISRHLDRNEEMKKTILMGLYLRFKKEDEKQDLTKFLERNIKEDPIAFETFVAEIIKVTRGGDVWVSPASNDYGVDFEHTTEEGLFLGQVKCKGENLSFEPIAFIHSNMVKRGVVGGYVITTSSFSRNAIKYAAGLNIELIDGMKLIDEWIESLSNSDEKVKQLIPRD